MIEYNTHRDSRTHGRRFRIWDYAALCLCSLLGHQSRILLLARSTVPFRVFVSSPRLVTLVRILSPFSHNSKNVRDGLLSSSQTALRTIDDEENRSNRICRLDLLEMSKTDCSKLRQPLTGVSEKEAEAKVASCRKDRCVASSTYICINLTSVIASSCPSTLPLLEL